MWYLPGSGIVSCIGRQILYHWATRETLQSSYLFFFPVMRTLKIYSLSNFQICNTVLLTIVTKETYQLHLWASYAKIMDLTEKESHTKSFWVDKFENLSFLNTLSQWVHSHSQIEEGFPFDQRHYRTIISRRCLIRSCFSFSKGVSSTFHYLPVNNQREVTAQLEQRKCSLYSRTKQFIPRKNYRTSLHLLITWKNK